MDCCVCGVEYFPYYSYSRKPTGLIAVELLIVSKKGSWTQVYGATSCLISEMLMSGKNIKVTAGNVVLKIGFN